MPDRTKTLEPPSQLRRYFVDIIGGRCLWPKRKPFDTCLSLRDFGDRYFYLMLRFLSSEDYPMKSTSKKRTPSIVNLTVKRRYLTQREIDRLMMEADTAIGPRERKPRKVPSPPDG